MACSRALAAHALLVATTAVLGAPDPEAFAGGYPNPREKPDRCGGYRGTETLICDPQMFLSRTLRATEQLDVALAAVKAWEEDFGVQSCGGFGVRAGIALVSYTEDPIQRFAEDLAGAWGLDDEASVLIVLQAGDAPSIALAGGLLRDPTAFEAAPEEWRAVMSRAVMGSLRLGVPGRAIEQALSGVADAIGGGLGHGMPLLAGGNGDVQQVMVQEFETRFQVAEVWRTACGEERCMELHLDDARQFSSRFERYYHEAMSLPALNIIASSGSPPKRVLMLGGGDGGVATVVLELDSIEHMTLLDIDADVAKLAKQHFPEVAKSFSDPRFVPLHVDAIKWVSEQAKADVTRFDLAIIDFTDMPLQSDWSAEFFASIRALLAPHGLLVHNLPPALRENQPRLRHMLQLHQEAFHSTFAMTAIIPDYMVEYTLALSSVGPIEPTNVDWSFWNQQKVRTMYYSPEIHTAMFATQPSILKMLKLPVEDAPAAPLSLRSAKFAALMPDWSMDDELIDDEPAGYKVYRSSHGYCDPKSEEEDDCRYIIARKVRYMSEFSILPDEAMTLPALNILGARGKRVLVLGGGTGYVAHLALQYPHVEQVVVVDGDTTMIELVQENFPTMAKALRDPRVEIVRAEPYKWLRGRAGEFDLIVNSIRHMPWNSASRRTRAAPTSRFLAQLRGMLAPHGMLAQEAGTVQQPRHAARMMALHRAAFRTGSVWPLAHAFDATCYAGLSVDAHFVRPPALSMLSSPSIFDPKDVDWAQARQRALVALRYSPNWHQALFALPMEIQRLFGTSPSLSAPSCSGSTAGTCSSFAPQHAGTAA